MHHKKRNTSARLPPKLIVGPDSVYPERGAILCDVSLHVLSKSGRANSDWCDYEYSKTPTCTCAESVCIKHEASIDLKIHSPHQETVSSVRPAQPLLLVEQQLN